MDDPSSPNDARDEALHVADDGEPSGDRLGDLLQGVSVNRLKNQPPLFGVNIRTRGELNWAMKQFGWTTISNMEPHPDLRGVAFTQADLRGADLRHADLRGAECVSTNLSGATLYYADLSNAELGFANLEEAKLGRANLTNAHMITANFKNAQMWEVVANGSEFAHANLDGADLSRANLIGARFFKAALCRASLVMATLHGCYLEEADLRGADLRQAHFDADTSLAKAQLDSTAYLGDVFWNGVPLGRVDWQQAPTLGDDQLLDDPLLTASALKAEKVLAYREVARAYRGLSTALRAQALIREAPRYRLRAERLERSASRYEHTPRGWVSWLWSGLLDLVAGYGEQPWKPFAAYLVVLTTFCVAFLLVANLHDPRLLHLSWWEWPALSVTAFHGRGFFPGTLPQPPSGWITLLALMEAVVGLFIEAVFIATFSRRFLGN